MEPEVTALGILVPLDGSPLVAPEPIDRFLPILPIGWLRPRRYARACGTEWSAGSGGTSIRPRMAAAWPKCAAPPGLCAWDRH